MDFFRRHRVLSFLLFLVLFSVLTARIVAPRFLTAQTAPSSPAGSLLGGGANGGGFCSKIGNNGAIQFGNSEVAYDEAAYTLALYSGAESEKTAIINAIKSSQGKIIIRLGAGGTAPSGPAAPQYAAALNQIAASVDGKPFIAMAGHNEPNCNEFIPLANESIYMQTIAKSVTASNVTLITGQIDTYCTAKDKPAPINYITALGNISGIKGISVPFYTGVAGGATETIAQLKGVLKSVGGKDVYVTESGPYVQGTGEGDFTQYANAIQGIISEPQIKGLLLFNAFGANPDANYTYTKPFWNPDCREALRTQCQDPAAVIEACSQLPTNYFEYNLQRKGTTSLLRNLSQDYSVACMPKETFKLVAKNREQCGLANIGCGQWNTSGELNLSAEGKLFGLFRNEKAVNSRISANKNTNKRTESIETYLGVPSVNQPRATDQPVASPDVSMLSVKQGPIYSLTTLNQQCQMIKDKLEAVNNLCNNNRIEGDKAKCGLNTRIPGTTFTHLTLRSALQNKSCEELMHPAEDDLATNQLKTAILSTPLAMETAYRPAFIVAVTKFEKTNENVTPKSDPSIPDQKFYTLDYLEVKVPAFGSDFLPSNPSDPKSSTKNGAYKDPLQITADLLTSNEDRIKFQEKVLANRQALQAQVQQPAGSQAGGTSFIKGGRIGDSGATNTYCFIDSKWQLCNEQKSTVPDNDSFAGPDRLPVALAGFINAYNNAGLLTKDALPCDAGEPTFYSPENKLKIAEQVESIGSDLGTKAKTGVFTKKQSISVPYRVNVADLQKDLSYNTTTQLYFVSPHNEELQYAQKSFYNFLSLRDQEQLKELGLLTENGVLDPQQLSPLAATQLDDKFTGSAEQRSNFGKVEAETPQTGGNQPTGRTVVSLGLESDTTPENEPKKHPIFWQVAGQVANLPTRLMALLTSTTDSTVHKFTLKCSTSDDPETLSHATENWLKGKCGDNTVADVTNTNDFCKAADPSKATSAEYHGLTSQISDGVIATALEVSKYTCVPAEVLVGVMAKESRGLTNVNGVDVPATGDPNQIITRQSYCNNLDPGDQNSTEYFQACGAYQYTQSNIRDQIARYGVAITSCLDKIAPGDTDTRKLGVSMCVAAANIWRSTYCSKNSCGASNVGTMYGCTPGKSSSLADLATQGYNKTNLLAGIAAFHGNHDADENYWAFVEQYVPAVEAVRAQCK